MGLARRATRRLGFLATFLLTALVYAPGTGNGLLKWDDDRIVAGDPFLTRVSWAGLVDFFTQIRNEAYQPLHRLSYWLDLPWLGLNARALHVTNLLLWSLAAGIWFLVLCRSGRSIAAAVVATALVALHPTQVEAVSWVTGRKDALALLFVGLSCLAFCARRHGWSSLAYACAVLSKTTSLPLPLLFIAFDLIVRKQRPRAAVRAQLASLATMLVLGALLVVIWRSHELVRPSDVNRALLVLATLGHYAKTVVWPLPLSPIYPIWYTAGELPATAWLGLAALAAAAFALRKSPAWRFSLAGFVLLLVPVSNLVPLYFQRADRYLSLPLAALSWGFADSFDRSRWTRAGLVGFVLLLAGVNLSYQPAWANDVTLWTHGTQAQPAAFYAWLQLGHAERDAGHYPQSIDAYEHAVETQPQLALGHSALFLAVVRHEAPDDARQLFSVYQSALGQPQLLQSLASDLILRDARNSAALVFRRMLDSGILDRESQRGLAAAARASSRPWVARALEAAHPASDDLR